jgi:beta-ketodecanoyl-[acyl-carrier-protein] synthase
VTTIAAVGLTKVGAMQTTGLAITGTGVWTPPDIITNEELCEAFNEFVRRENRRNADAIERGDQKPLQESSPEFILKASGIEQRHVHDKTGLLDPDRMCPNVPDRPEEEMSVQCEYAVNAARLALAKAGRVGEEIDMVLLSGSNLQRPYPQIAMEVQEAIGARGFAYDLLAGCSSATFPIQIASDALRAGSASKALLVNPEMTTGHMNWRDRDSHFIFGDAATAIVIEPVSEAKEGGWEIVSTRLMSKFSSNIRNNGGYLDRCDPDTQFSDSKLFHQKGRRVFKDVVPMASTYIREHLESVGLTPDKVTRFWLHQANRNMNELIMKYLIGAPASRELAPLILDTYANTASAGSIIAFNNHSDDLASGDIGILCSFGAGYSIGSVIVRKL